MKKMKFALVLMFLFTNFILGQTLSGNKFVDYTNTHSLDEEGNTIAVINTIPNNEQNIEVFDFVNNQWQKRPSNDGFIGFQIQLSGDGNTLIIVSEALALAEKVSIYYWNGSSWSQRGDVFTSGTRSTTFSDRVYVNDDGTRIFFRGTQGEYFNYYWDGNSWILINTFSNLGNSEISINNDGTRLAYTENNSSNSSIANYNIKVLALDGNDIWSQIGEDIVNPLQLFSSSVSVSLAFNSIGNKLAIASPTSFEFNTRAGAFAVYEFTNNEWNQIGNIVTGENENDSLGADIAINAGGNKVFVGIPLANTFGQESGQSKLFELDIVQNTWNEVLTISGQLSGSQSGTVLGMNGTGDILSIGANGILPQVRVFGVNSLNTNNNDLLRFNMYPNPSYGELFLDLNQVSQLEIFDLNGRAIRRQEQLQPGKNKVNLQGLNNGLYLIKISNLNGQIVQKLQLSK
jgi:hypothetical protein